MLGLSSQKAWFLLFKYPLVSRENYDSYLVNFSKRAVQVNQLYQIHLNIYVHHFVVLKVWQMKNLKLQNVYMTVKHMN